MKHISRLNLAASAVATGLLLTVLSVGAAAQTSIVVPDESQRSLGAPTVTKALLPPPENGDNTLSTAHLLKGTYFNSGNWGGGFFAGGNVAYPVDNQLTVSCPGTTTCTIEADQFVEEGNAPTASSGGLCLDVDNGGWFYCWDSGYSQGPNIYGAFSEIFNVSGLKPGSHTVQTWLFSWSGTDLYQYYITYHVYTP